MSFYGSVYYQLIDTFYKVAVKNTGATSSSFLTSVDANEELSNQAVGRKGVFGLDSGNRWVNFSKQVASDETATYKIWHGKPDPAGKNPAHGFQKIDPSSLSAEQLAAVKHLNHDDYFRTYETTYDAAGHIVTSQEHLYQLPIAEVNKDVELLLKTVGKATEGRSDTDISGNKIETLYDYVEDNYDNINILQDYVGDLPLVTDYWGEDWAIGKLSIADIIGDLDEVLNTSSKAGGGYHYVNKSNFKSLSSIIGNLFAMYQALDPANADPQERTLTGAITFVFEYLTNFITNTYTTKVDSLTASIATTQIALGGLDDKVDDLIGDLEDLSERHDLELKNLSDKHTNEINAETNARVAADNELTSKITAEQSAREQKDNAIDAEINNLKAEDESIRAAFVKADESIVSAQNEINAAIRQEYAAADAKIREDFAKADSDLETTLKAEDKKISDALAAATEAQSTINTNLQKGYEDADSALSNEINDLDTKFTERCDDIDKTIAENKTAAETALTEFKINVIGTIGEDTDVMTEIEESNSNIETNASNIEALDTRLGESLGSNSAFEEIQNIYNTLGTSTIGENVTITSAIAKNQSDISSTNNDISTLSSNLSTANNTIGEHTKQISNINTTIGEIQSSIGSNQTNIAQNRTDIGIVSNDLTQFKADMQGVSQMVDKHDPAIIELQKRNEEHKQEYEALYKKLVEGYLPTQDIEKTYVKNNTLELYLSKEEASAPTGYLKKEEASRDYLTNTAFTDIVGDTKGVLVEGQTLVSVLSQNSQDIESNATKIAELESALAALEARINELHPDENTSQTPENENNGETIE